MTRLFCLLTVLAIAASVRASDEAPAPPDRHRSPLAEKYEKAMASESWSWSDVEVGILRGLAVASSRYDVVLVRHGSSPPPLLFTIKILDGQREVYRWEGVPETAFILRGERLYYVRFDNRGGGAVVAVDLKAGKEIWNSPLHGLENIPPPSFRLEAILRTNGESVSTLTRTAVGRYSEAKDAKTGETIGYKAFDAPANKRGRSTAK